MTMQEALEEAKKMYPGMSVCVSIDKWHHVHKFDDSTSGMTECRISVIQGDDCKQHRSTTWDLCIAQMRAELIPNQQELPTEEGV